MDKLIETCIEQIKEDIRLWDITAIQELLRYIPVENLINYLPENKHEEFNNLKS